MSLNRKDFINLSAIAGTSIVAGLSSCSSSPENAYKKSVLDDLNSMTGDIAPITTEEREARIVKAQGLMKENDLQALILDAGTSLKYFTGISWWPSERTMVAIIPATGDVSYVCHGFEEERLRELIKIGKTVNAWQVC